MQQTDELRRAVLARFLPTTASVLGGVVAAIWIANPSETHFVAAAVAGLEVATMTAGYGMVLGALRRRVRAGVRLDGARSVLAGVVAPVGLGVLAMFNQGASVPRIEALSLATGALAALAVWAPMLLNAPRPPEKSLDELEAEVDAELARLEALAPPPHERRPAAPEPARRDAPRQAA